MEIGEEGRAGRTACDGRRLGVEGESEARTRRVEFGKRRANEALEIFFVIAEEIYSRQSRRNTDGHGRAVSLRLSCEPAAIRRGCCAAAVYGALRDNFCEAGYI